METETSTKKKIFLAINCILLAIGNVGGPLILRLYFIHGGRRLWFTSWLQTAGWPIILIPLLVSYTRRRRAQAELFVMNTRVLLVAVVMGVLIGADNYFYSYGLAKLPVSTSSLIIATQLAFTAAFAFLLVKQNFTAYSINDRPEGESDMEYWLGFAMTVMAAALYGLVELTYKKAKQEVTYTVVLEMQLVISFIATVVCTVGMLINNDFQAIWREAKEFEVGERKYYAVVVCSGIIWQCFFLGGIGVIFYSSSLLSGILITVLLPITEVLAVFIFHEKFTAEKGTSLFLSFWGLLSYFWGERNHTNNLNHKHHTPPHQTSDA